MTVEKEIVSIKAAGLKYPNALLDEIRVAILVSDVVGKKVSLKQNGRDYSGLCPFHKEKSPSFTVNDEKGFYHCFGCGAHGDIIKFVMETDGLPFPDTIHKLADEAGIIIDAKLLIEFEAKKKAEQEEQEEKQWQEYVACFKKYIQYPSRDIASMLMLLSGQVPNEANMNSEEDFNFFVGDIAEFFELAFRIDDVPIAKKGTRLDGHDSFVRPKEFLKWCIDVDAPLKEDVKKLSLDILGYNILKVADKSQKIKNSTKFKETCITDKGIYEQFLKQQSIWLKSAVYICSGLVENLPEEGDWEYHEFAELFASNAPEIERLNFINHTIGYSEFSKNFPFEEYTGINYSNHGEKEYVGLVEPLKFVEWLLGRTSNLPMELKQAYFEEKEKVTIGYITPYIVLMQRAIAEFNISDENQPKVKEELVPWFIEKLKVIEGNKGVENKAKLMATFVRLPESAKGGVKKFNKNNN